MVRRYADTIQVADRGIADFPEAADSFRLHKSEALLAQGDTKGARAALEGTPPNNFKIIYQRFNIALYERNYAEARRAIAARLQFPNQEEISPVDVFEGFIAMAERDAEKAKAAFLAARQGYEIRVRAHPENPFFHSMPAIVDAALGDKEAALRKNREAMKFIDDPLEKNSLLIDLATIYCWTGERDRALAQIEGLAKIPNGLSYGELRLDPAWDSLRSDPRFKKIVASLKPK
jgi:tetratricopeptide (TPR) repeat protein